MSNELTYAEMNERYKTKINVEKRVRENAHKAIILVHPSSRVTSNLSCNPRKKIFTMKRSIIQAYNQEHLLHPVRSISLLNIQACTLQTQIFRFHQY